MTLRIYNTLTGKKEEFVPLHEKQVRMYVCGVTVYDLCHIGHARSTVIFDMIHRYLRYRGYEVIYVRNFTDIDDKIIKRANEEGVDYKTIAEKYIAEFNIDMGRFGLLKPSVEPKATGHIVEMIQLISTLVEKGYAYPAEGNVFFSIEKFKGYGKLSKRDLEEMQAGARVEIDEKKGNPLDFALWKASKPGEPFWESPWGKGRPGWHIECSVMSQKYLGETLDIHGGGKDLIFPHHENEMSQSEAATGKPFVRYWIHNGFVNINKEKMSKSLGNILTLKEIFKDWRPEVIRLFLLSHHYRSPVDFSFDSLSEAKSGLDRFYTTLKGIKEELSKVPLPLTPTCPNGTVNRGEGLPSGVMKYTPQGRGGGDSTFEEAHQAIESFKTRLEEAMDDDFNAAQALGYFYDIQRYLNTLLDISKGHPTEEIVSLLKQGLNHLSQMGWIFGLFQEDPEVYLGEQKKEGLKKLNLSEEEILKLIEDRNLARREKNWKQADEIRNDLLSKGILLEDTPSGTIWKIK
ncbi:MAG: cysteine--tRNA ligase [Deltaproteobacteria bacterium RBG_16_47_11]|nr:MAG: cysteine--tRNA ligase [Deltaproteobacteria bacterium RBG_16_47_11]